MIQGQGQGRSMANTIENFGDNVSFQPQGIYFPENVDELLQLMSDHPESQFRAIGSLHSWSDVTITTGVLLNLRNMDAVTITDRGTVVVGAGCQIKNLLAALSKKKMTLPSVGLIAEQTVAGATATGTHGSGRNSLSHYIRSVSIAHFDEDGRPVISTVDSGTELLAARCSLGLMGVIFELELEIRPEYSIEEHGRHHPTLNSIFEMEKTYPLQQFYLMPWSWSYYAHHRRETEISASRFTWVYRIYRLFVVDVLLHIVAMFLARFFRFKWAIRFFYRAVLPFTIIRNWKVADRSTNQLTMNHHWFRHLEIELFVRREKLPTAMDFLMDALKVFADQKSSFSKVINERLTALGLEKELENGRGRYCHHFPICIRRIIEDETLLSMACDNGSEKPECDQQPTEGDRDWFAISLISFHHPSDRNGFFAFANFIGPCFAQLFGGRSHWGKYNQLSHETNLRLYPRLDKFREVIRRFDPEGRFQNKWLDRTVGQTES